MKKISLLLLTLLLSAAVTFAQSKDEKAVATAVESLRRAMLDPDKAALEALTTANLTWGHSSGLLEDRAAFVEALVSGKSDFITINLTDQTVKITGNVAVVRHVMRGEANNGPVNIGILLVWLKEGGDWKVLARQAYKL